MSGASFVNGLFKPGSIGEQFMLWNVGSAVASAGMAPLLARLQSATFFADPDLPADPATLVELVARGYMDHAAGANEAQYSGIPGGHFTDMVNARMHGPDLTAAFELYRRGKIAKDGGAPDEVSLGSVLTDMGIHPGWHDVLMELAVQPPTPQEALVALLQGQIPRDEAYKRYVEGGGDPTWFQAAFDSNGSAPTPVEAATMANRGIIPWGGSGAGVVSFEQAFLEGPWRNKWEPSFRALAEYLPPPRTVTALQKEGVITEAQALSLYEKTGLSQELAAAYVHSANVTKTTAEHNLAKADVLALYSDKLITGPEALTMLEGLRYSTATAQFLLEITDFRAAAKLLTNSVSRIRTLYIGHKITQTAAKEALATYKVPAVQVGELLTHWDLDRALNVKTLTEAQIVTAFAVGIMTQGEATRELVNIGYTEFDAWVLLSNHKKEALPNKPAQGSNPVTVNP